MTIVFHLFNAFKLLILRCFFWDVPFAIFIVVRFFFYHFTFCLIQVLVNQSIQKKTQTFIKDEVTPITEYFATATSDIMSNVNVILNKETENMQITVTDIFPWNRTDENTNQFSAKHYVSTFNERRKDVLSYKIITGKTTNPNPKMNPNPKTRNEIRFCWSIKHV